MAMGQVEGDETPRPEGHNAHTLVLKIERHIPRLRSHPRLLLKKVFP